MVECKQLLACISVLCFALACGDGDSPALDSDGDGVPDHVECDFDSCHDTDGDRLPNYLDDDDDNDGIPTLIENAAAGDTADEDPATDAALALAVPASTLSADADSCPTTLAGSGPDADGDCYPNYVDLDSDGDGYLDETEGTLDSDGLPDWLDQTTTMGVPASFFGALFQGLFTAAAISPATFFEGRALAMLNIGPGVSNADILSGIQQVQTELATVNAEVLSLGSALTDLEKEISDEGCSTATQNVGVWVANVLTAKSMYDSLLEAAAGGTNPSSTALGDFITQVKDPTSGMLNSLSELQTALVNVDEMGWVRQCSRAIYDNQWTKAYV